MSHRVNVLSAYRELISLIHRLAPERVQPALQEARAAVRANKAEADPMRASDQLKDLYARISFLRMATPRLPRDRFFRGGSGSFVLRDGELVPGAARKESRMGDGKISMDEGYRRHQQLLKRQHFGREPPKVRQTF